MFRQAEVHAKGLTRWQRQLFDRRSKADFVNKFVAGEIKPRILLPA